MKKSLLMVLFCAVVFVFTSCLPVQYGGSNAYYGQVNQTEIVLNQNNFNVLGSFSGRAIGNVNAFSVKDKNGLVSQAKQNFLENAKAAGVTLTGGRAIVNSCVDYVTNGKKVAVTFSAEIIEFTK